MQFVFPDPDPRANSRPQPFRNRRHLNAHADDVRIHEANERVTSRDKATNVTGNPGDESIAIGANHPETETLTILESLDEKSATLFGDRFDISRFGASQPPTLLLETGQLELDLLHGEECGLDLGGGGHTCLRLRR